MLLKYVAPFILKLMLEEGTVIIIIFIQKCLITCFMDERKVTCQMCDSAIASLEHQKSWTPAVPNHREWGAI